IHLPNVLCNRDQSPHCQVLPSQRWSWHSGLHRENSHREKKILIQPNTVNWLLPIIW
ncbi:nanos 1, partial [Biomphalaria pfeifferi]